MKAEHMFKAEEPFGDECQYCTKPRGEHVNRPDAFAEAKELTPTTPTFTPGPWKWIGTNKRPNEPIYLQHSDKDADDSWILAIMEGKQPESANARLIAAAPVLYNAARCALADLEGVMPEFEPSGDREHPGWKTIDDLRAALALVEGK